MTDFVWFLVNFLAPARHRTDRNAAVWPESSRSFILGSGLHQKIIGAKGAAPFFVFKGLRGVTVAGKAIPDNEG